MSLDTLLQELNSPNERIRLRAMYQLGILGDPAAISALQNAYENDPTPQLKNVAHAAAQHIQETKAADKVRDAELDVVWTQKFVQFVEGSGLFMALDISDLTEGVSQQAGEILRQAGKSAPVVQATPKMASDAPASANSLAGAMQTMGSPMEDLNAKFKAATGMDRVRKGPEGNRSETTGVYQMLWDCEACGTEKLLGVTHRFCPNCGAAQNPAKRYFPNPGEEVALENHTYYGVDWICPSCEQTNSANAHFCVACGSDKTGAKSAELRQEMPAGGKGGALGIAASGDGLQARDLVKEKFDEDMRRVKADEKAAARNKPIFLGLRRKELSIMGIVTALVSCIVAAVFAFMYSRSEDLTVAGHSWERTVHLEEFRAVDETKDCSAMPGDAYDVSRRNETRTRRVADGQTCSEQCTNRRVDQGDGSFRTERTCRDVCTTNYRNENYTVQVCNYTLDRWSDGRDVRANGSSTSPEPYWPDYTLAIASGSRNLGQERVDEREEKYILIFERDGGDEAECEYENMSVWEQYTVNQAVRMNFDILGDPKCDTLKAR